MTDRPFEKVRYLDDVEFHLLERALVRLEDEKLTDDEYQFADDLGRRLIDYGRRTIVTGRQWQKMERLKEKYLD